MCKLALKMKGTNLIKLYVRKWYLIALIVSKGTYTIDTNDFSMKLEMSSDYISKTDVHHSQSVHMYVLCMYIR